jgi:protein TonB
MSSPVRAACWLVSGGLHVVAFVAAGHPERTSAAASRDSLQPIAIDVATEPMPEASEPPVAPGARSPSFVPRPTHTHAYPVPIDHDAQPHDPSLVHLPFALAAPTPPETLAAAPLEPARFTMTVASDRVGGAVVATSSAASPAGDGLSDRDAAPVPEDRVSLRARLATAMVPRYPAEARAQEVEADVVLEIVVASTGEVVDARVLTPAGFGFDQEALRAVRAARFVPAEHEGRRVAVRMRWSFPFRLR